MFEKKDYSKLTLEELIQEEIKVKKSQKIITVIAFLACGITLYAIYKHDVNFIHTVLPLGSILYIGKLGENLKAIKQEISNKKSS